MKARLLFSTSVFFLSLFGFSQTDNYIFKADFNQVDNNFPVGENDVENSYVKDGNYYLNVTDSTKSYRVYHRISVDPDEDFAVIASVKRTKGKASRAYGICFGYQDIDNASYFFIKENGTFEIFKYENGKQVILSGPSKTNYLSAAGQFNVLLIERIKDKLHFYVNYKVVASLPYTHFPAQKYGLYAVGPMEIACDYFYVRQKRDAINLIEGWDKFGKLVRLGPEINSKMGEIMPVVSADESHLYVTRKGYDSEETANDDVYYSTLNADSTWKPLKSIGKPINNASHNFVCGTSSDNNELLLGGTYNSSGTYAGKGFSRTHHTKDGWSIPKTLNIKNYYNDDQYVEMCPSHDFKTILMAIRRKDTYGYKDLYVSTMLPDSTWTEPMNLGKEINTFGEEDSPFLAPDNITLYFASDGWPGYGSNDIFMSKRLDDTWKHWSKPKNLGPVINSDKWDAYYTTSASGKYAYVVSNKGDDYHGDIYQVKQPESARPEALLIVKGKVLNSKTKQPMKATVTYSVIGSNKTVGHIVSNAETGMFTIALHKGQKYAFTAHHDGYLAEHRNSDVIDLKNYKEEEVDLLLTPFEKGESVIMHNLFFVASKPDILPDSEGELNRLYELLSENKKMKVEIGGHTSINTSSEKWNYDLSYNRAKAVKDYLTAKGIKDDRIMVKGYGNSKPIDKVFEESHQAKNRRVEFTILDK
jgi:outer membrane protein OmpA-like peptidoglycan-associated protein